VKPQRSTALWCSLNGVLWEAFGVAYIATAPGFGAGSSGETVFRVVGWS
jgi:hypothetical protein